jgi:hypothetical protein
VTVDVCQPATRAALASAAPWVPWLLWGGLTILGASLLWLIWLAAYRWRQVLRARRWARDSVPVADPQGRRRRPDGPPPVGEDPTGRSLTGERHPWVPATDVVTTTARPHLRYDDVMALYAKATAGYPGPPHPVNVTRAEFQHLAQLFPHVHADPPDWSTIGRASMLGIPLVVVDPLDDERSLVERLTAAFHRSP